MGGFGALLLLFIGRDLVVASFACCFVVATPSLVSIKISFAAEVISGTANRSADINTAPVKRAEERNAIVGHFFATL